MVSERFVAVIRVCRCPSGRMVWFRCLSQLGLPQVPRYDLRKSGFMFLLACEVMSL
jgi:hypothetical protein